MADSNITAPIENLQANADGSFNMPDGRSLADAMFEMNDGNLLVTWPDGAISGVENFIESLLVDVPRNLFLLGQTEDFIGSLRLGRG